MPKIETDAKGIPVKADHPAVAMGIPIPIFYLIFNGIMLSIGLAVAYFIAFPNDHKSASKIATLASLDLGWLYLGAWVLKLGALMLGINLGSARLASKVAVPDQHCYQVKGAEGSKLGYVLMETEGDIGKFNRAQRALQNYNEIFPMFVLMFVLAAFVCPFAAFMCACVFAAARAIQAVGYTKETDGRIPGTMLGLLATTVLEAIVLLAGISAVDGDALPLL